MQWAFFAIYTEMNYYCLRMPPLDWSWEHMASTYGPIGRKAGAGHWERVAMTSEGGKGTMGGYQG